MEFVIAAGVLGFAGSVHCAGMCGGFFLMASRANWTYSIHYAVGKTVSYAMLGALAGALGAGAASFSGFRSAFSICMGLLLIVGGLTWAGWLPRIIKNGKFSSNISSLIGHAMKASGFAGPLSLGLANGLLPCGLLYGGLVIAATSGTLLNGTLAMTAFGLATIPALVIFGVAAQKLGTSFIRRAHIAGGIAMIAFGLLTIVRALSLQHHLMPM